ncbi:MAG: hypothetical protein WC917_00355 [Bacilli bacterium]|jgi:hypothetical protein
MIDIFEKAEEKKVPEWAKFVNAGDSVQGTYVGKIVGQKDGYGNEQIIYQLLQDDGKVVNVGFGLNKKVLHMDMQPVTFGQIVGFRYKGTIQVKDKFGKPVSVKDFGLHQDPKIVNEVWLAENKDNMPEVVKAMNTFVDQDKKSNAGQSLDEFVDELKNDADDDVPFSSPGSLTNEDKLLVIEKLAKEKLGAVTAQEIKDKVMEKTGIAFIAVNYDKISEALVAL